MVQDLTKRETSCVTTNVGNYFMPEVDGYNKFTQLVLTKELTPSMLHTWMTNTIKFVYHYCYFE